MVQVYASLDGLFGGELDREIERAIESIILFSASCVEFPEIRYSFGVMIPPFLEMVESLMGRARQNHKKGQ